MRNLGHTDLAFEFKQVLLNAPRRQGTRAPIFKFKNLFSNLRHVLYHWGLLLLVGKHSMLDKFQQFERYRFNHATHTLFAETFFIIALQFPPTPPLPIRPSSPIIKTPFVCILKHILRSPRPETRYQSPHTHHLTFCIHDASNRLHSQTCPLVSSPLRLPLRAGPRRPMVHLTLHSFAPHSTRPFGHPRCMQI